jgi:hypothetical protein
VIVDAKTEFYQVTFQDVTHRSLLIFSAAALCARR